MVIYQNCPHILIKDVICGVMAMKMSKLLKMLPFLIILAVSCILLLTKIFRVDSIMADDSIKTEQATNNFEIIPFFWTVGIVGGCIGLTLVYVSWRKYKAEEKKKLEKEKQKKSYL